LVSGKKQELFFYIPKKGKNDILISSLHFDDAIDCKTGRQLKPEVVAFYNRIKFGVDTVDQMCSTYNVVQSSRCWLMVIFYTLLNISRINSQVICMGNKNEVKNH
jgi:hypothetical protein